MSDSIINTDNAPDPVGAYPHARRVGNLLFLSGVGSRTPQTNEIPGGPIVDENDKPLDYDVAAQTEQVVANIKAVLAASGLTLPAPNTVVAIQPSARALSSRQPIVPSSNTTASIESK